MNGKQTVESLNKFFAVFFTTFFLVMIVNIGHAQSVWNLSGIWENEQGQVFTIDQIDSRVEWFYVNEGIKIVGKVSGDCVYADWGDYKIIGKIFTDNRELPTIVEWSNNITFKRVYDNNLNLEIENPDIEELVSPEVGLDSDWQLIQSAVSRFYASGNRLYFTRLSTGDIYDGQSWFRIGGPGHSFACNYRGDLYAVSDKDKSVWIYTGTPNKWNRIRQSPSDYVFAGGKYPQTCAIDSHTKDVYLYWFKGCYPNCVWEWSRIGGPGIMFQHAFQGIYGLATDKGSIWKWVGDQTWTHLGGAADQIAVDWTTSEGEVLYALSPDRTKVMRHWKNGNGENHWEDYTFNLPNVPKSNIDAGWDVVVVMIGEEVWMMQHGLKHWIQISGAWRVKRVLAAGENKPVIYCLFMDNSLWRYRGFD